jgi:hypothetical protein
MPFGLPNGPRLGWTRRHAPLCVRGENLYVSMGRGATGSRVACAARHRTIGLRWLCFFGPERAEAYREARHDQDRCPRGSGLCFGR